jgi:hypothetical protein
VDRADVWRILELRDGFVTGGIVVALIQAEVLFLRRTLDHQRIEQVF